MKIAYVVNTYPRASHSFIRREIQALERRGLTIHRFAMRDDIAGLVDPADIDEHRRTEHVLTHGAVRLAMNALTEMLRSPRRGLSALLLARACGARAGRAQLRHLVYLAEAAWLVGRCRTLGITHLHAHFGTNSASVAMLAATLGGLRYSFTVHGPEEFDHPQELSLGQKAASAAFTVAISSFGRSQLCRWTPFDDWPRLHVVHCGIEPSRFPAPAAMPAGAGRMVAIGRFSEQKGHVLLLDALAAALESTPGLTLTLVGDGELRAAMEARVKALGLNAAVTFAGWRDEAGVRAALAEAHALVLPSFAEGLPMVVMEAMAAGRPVIATSIAGVPELVQDGKTGWLVPAGDTDALAKAMTELAATPSDKLADMGLAGRRRVLKRHDIDIEAEKLAALFDAAMG